MNFNNIVSRVGIGVVILVWIFFGLKGCVMTIWEAPDSTEIYSIAGEDDRSMSIFILPGHQAMIWYHDPMEEHIEGTLARMKGTYGTHYFWRLWGIDGPGIWFGYRIYPTDTEPVVMEMTVLEHYQEGRGKSDFPGKGDTSYQVILFGEDKVNFEGMWLYREPSNPDFEKHLLEKLGGPQPLH